ncbi:MAG: type I restriction enzyme HsdR N-terminal domain-containing protein [Ferruginibacter sp.]
MIRIEYPSYRPRIKTEMNIEKIFDPYRKKWIVLTPEEWVRQNFLQYLVQVLGYPVSLIAIEKEIYLGEVKKRFDIVVYNREAMPYIIVECKEMQVKLTKNVLHQALRYNTNMQATFLIITNGNYCYAYERKDETFKEIETIPFFEN